MAASASASAAAFGARLRTVDAGGLRMQVADAGNGPPVVLPHGFPERRRAWRRRLRDLRLREATAR